MSDILKKIKEEEEKEKLTMGLAENLELLRTNLEDLVQFQASISIVLRAKFDALVKAGFTEQQALEIVKARGMNP